MSAYLDNISSTKTRVVLSSMDPYGLLWKTKVKEAVLSAAKITGHRHAYGNSRYTCISVKEDRRFVFVVVRRQVFTLRIELKERSGAAVESGIVRRMMNATFTLYVLIKDWKQPREIK